MASISNLKISWNFDLVTGSDAGGGFTILDTQNTYHGGASGFAASTSSFVLKEDLKTNKKVPIDTLESIDTINIRDDEDDLSVTNVLKPSSVQLLVENSMYQIISDEMLNMFATADAYAFKYTEAYNKYKDEYEQLKASKEHFFSKIQEKPDLEKYIEFYKWIDSALGELLDKLKPETSKTQTGLKNTIESHILERNKYKHQLPLFVQPNRTYTSGISVIKTERYGKLPLSSTGSYLTASLKGAFEESTYNIAQDFNRNKTHETIQSAGKQYNNREGKTNKSILTTNFSAGDGLSEKNRHEVFSEFSVYNELNQRARNVRDSYNLQLSQELNLQGTDNTFLQRNIPYTASNYHTTGVVNYQNIPSPEVQFRQRNNIIVDDVDKAYVLEEPAVYFNVPVKQNVVIFGALGPTEIYSPFYNKIDTFSPRFHSKSGSNPNLYFDKELYRSPISETFFSKSLGTRLIGQVTTEILDNLYPRKDLMGIDFIRNKFRYEEENGNFNGSQLTWSQNSFNNNSADIRTFWKSDIEDRKRFRGVDSPFTGSSGSINCLGGINSSASIGNSVFRASSSAATPNNFLLGIDQSDGSIYRANLVITGNNNYYDSVYCLDGKVSVDISGYENPAYPGQAKYYSPAFYFNNEVVSDLSPNPHTIKANLIRSSSLSYNGLINYRAKPEFIFNNYYGTLPFAFGGINFVSIFNTSYQENLDTLLKPWYDSYKQFSSNIKHKSQYHSIVPEFAISNYPQYFKSNAPLGTTDYLKFLGRENFDSFQIYNEKQVHIADFNKFYNKATNKIKFIFNGIKKLLPYNGFYPQQRSVQIAKLFGDAFFNGSQSEFEKQFLLTPFYAPGIFFNTIKSGLAVSYPTIRSTNATQSYNNLFTASFTWSDTTLPYSSDYSASVIKTGTTFTRIRFETILDPAKYLSLRGGVNNYLYHVDPTHYSLLFMTGSSYTNANTFVPSAGLIYLKNAVEASASQYSLYKYAINNFLSEVPNFFLKDNNLTTFLSTKTENEFLEVTSGTNYEMKIRIDKNSNFSLFKKYLDDFGINISSAALFGPPTQISESYGVIYNEDSYAPFAPPYYYSDRVNPYDTNNVAYNEIKLRYTPNASGKPTLVNIFRYLNVITPSEFTNNYALTNAMPLSDCLNYKEAVKDVVVTVDPTTGKRTAAVQNTDNQRWAIQTKFETPLIDFTDVFNTNILIDSIATTGTVSLTGSTADQVFGFAAISSSIQGIWNSYGVLPQDNQSIQLSITDEGIENSLMDIVGFRAENKSIGVIANEKKITEAVVILPFVQNLRSVNLGNNLIGGGTQQQTVPQLSDKLKLDASEQVNLFTIDKTLISSLLKVPDYTKLTIEEIKLILETDNDVDRTNSIVDLMIKMVNYNIPPHLNWLLDADKKTPYVMYIAEFEHLLSKQELADIWQGTMPEIAQTPTEQSVVLEHYLLENQLFAGVNLNNFNIKMKIFKCKKRANNNYNQITANKDDDLNTTRRFPWYTYNWPYDYFSLVELVNIQGGEKYEQLSTRIG